MKQGRLSDGSAATLYANMTRLNSHAAEIAVRVGAHAATDVTGFGLLGHGLEMARASGTRFAFDASKLPALDGALDLARAGVETGGAAHNRRFVLPALDVADGVAPELVTLAHDPQTSGGLLAAVPRASIKSLHQAFLDAGLDHWPVGRVEAGPAGVALT
jgi:selenide,water dikinase